MHGNQFYRGLLHEKVTKFAVIHEGEAMIDLLAQIEKKKGDNHRFTQDVRNLLNSFSLKVVNRTCKVLDNMIDPPYLLQKTSENPPCVLISAEQDLFAQVLDANLSFEKGTYFSKKMLKGVSLSILVPTEIR